MEVRCARVCDGGGCGVGMARVGVEVGWQGWVMEVGDEVRCARMVMEVGIEVWCGGGM